MAVGMMVKTKETANMQFPRAHSACTVNMAEVNAVGDGGENATKTVQLIICHPESHLPDLLQMQLDSQTCQAG